jgi:hypothetical protein
LSSNREPAAWLGRGATAPRRRAHSAPRTARRSSSSSAPVRPPTSLRPRPAATLGHAPSEAARAPRRAGVRARRADRTPPPLRTGSPSASSCPRASCYSRKSRRHYLQAGPALFKRHHFPLCAPPEQQPAIAAAAGELAALLALTAGQPSHSLP